MRVRIAVSLVAAATIVAAGGRQTPEARAPEPAAPAWDAATLEELAAADCVDGAGVAAQQFREGGVADDKWPPGAMGGILPPVRSVADPFPTFDGMALDPGNNRVIISD